MRRPCVNLSGGETTVTVRGQGRGGRAAEFLMACDTDCTEDNAGAWFGPDLAEQIAERRLDPGTFLSRNDGYGFFAVLDRLIITGPTRTNVHGFRAIYLSA